jgi:hypothetical protein
VLRVQRELRLLVLVEPDLDHLPVPLMEAKARGELVVVVEVPEPVLQPELAVRVRLGVAVDEVAEVGALLSQPRVLGAVVLALDAEHVGHECVRAVGVLRAERLQAQPAARRGDHLTVRAPQLVAGVVGHLLRRVGEEGLLRVVLGMRLVALEKVAVGHGATLRR